MNSMSSGGGDEDYLLDGADWSERDNLTSGDFPPPQQHDFANVQRLLYTSHLLSTWNSRVFEFGVFLFLAEIYPHTLLPASVYALSGAAAAAVFSPWVGCRIDTLGRMRVIRQSILGQRLAVSISCVALSLMVWHPQLADVQAVSVVFLAMVSLLASVEKICAVMNLISVERDWVVIIASGDEERLRVLNAQMRRIDLFCKLLGPFAIALVDGLSTKVAIIAVGSLTVVSLPVEYFAIARVYSSLPELRAPKTSIERNISGQSRYRDIADGVRDGIHLYTTHAAFWPSFSLALLYATVLSFSGPMTTYLLSLGIKSGLLGGVRAISTVFEISATWAAPHLMSRIGPVRAGIWFLNWQCFCVGTACICLWLDLPITLAAVGLVSAVMASRVGLWGFDLSAQIIIQDEVEEVARGAFSSQETALQNIFEMLAFTSTIIVPKPEQFKYPATISACAVAIAAACYAAFVRARRGHLMHWSKCMERHSKGATGYGWQRIASAPADEFELQDSATSEQTT